MVFLNRIYTRSGDAGETSLGDGTRVPKTHPRVLAYGAVDELNCVIGVALTVPMPGELSQWLRQIQNDLFDLGADLCVPESRVERRATRDERRETNVGIPESGKSHGPDRSQRPPLRVAAEQVRWLEQRIDLVNEQLQPLESFVLPGGTPAAAHLHHARAVCRRAETHVVALANSEAINPQAVIYLNRLSDLLFVLARSQNAEGTGDVLWEPGRYRKA